MAADLDMDAPGGEGWGDDAELQLDEGKFSVLVAFSERTGPHYQYSDVVCLIFLFLHLSVSLRWFHGCPGRIRG